MAEDLGRMTRSEKTRMQVLVIVVGLLCLSLYYNSYSRTESIAAKPAPPARSLPPAPPSKNVPLHSVSQPDVLPSLPLLNQEVPAFTQSRRNVFEFNEGGDEEQQTAGEDPVEESTAASTQSGPESAPGSEITFVGIYVEKDKPDTRLAIVSVSKNVVVVKSGDLISGGYRVVKIGDDFLVLSVFGQKTLLRFPLGGTGVAQ